LILNRRTAEQGTAECRSEECCSIALRTSAVRPARNAFWQIRNSISMLMLVPQSLLHSKDFAWQAGIRYSTCPQCLLADSRWHLNVDVSAVIIVTSLITCMAGGYSKCKTG